MNLKSDMAQLREDHANFGRLLDVLESNVAQFEHGENPDYATMLSIATYMTEYPDRFHHPKEDLAVERLQARGALLAPVADELSVQHSRIIRNGLKLVEHIKAIAAESMIERASVTEAARSYIAAMRKHMEVEETRLFPLMDQLLGSRDWAAINAKLPALVDMLFGQPVEDKYQSLLRKIAA